MKISLLLTLFIFISCGKDEAGGDPIPDGFIDHIQINKMRDDISQSWGSWMPNEHEINTTTLGEGEVVDRDQEFICHYIFPKVRYEYVLIGLDEDVPEFDINRYMDVFELGPKTTGTDSYCNSRASKSDPLAIITHITEADVLLNLDRADDQESTGTKSFIPLEDSGFEASVISIQKADYSLGGVRKIGIYKLRYKVTGIAGSDLQNILKKQLSFSVVPLAFQEVTGFLTVYFSTRTVPSAWLLSYKFEFDIQGQPYIDEHVRVRSIDGYEIPSFRNM